MTIKRALRNIIRMPVRTILFSAVAFIMIFIICFCFSTASVSDTAIRNLDASYPFVATIIPKQIPNSDGTIENTIRLNLDILSSLQTSSAVSTYNFAMSAGHLAEDEIISVLPDDTILTKEPAPELSDIKYPVCAVNELYLEQAFMDGSYVITEGSHFTPADLYGGNRAIILSEFIAEKYQLGIGDTVNYNLPSSKTYRSCVVRGIFAERSGLPVAVAYIPLSDYFSDTANYKQQLSRADSNTYRERSLDSVVRIDFLLKSKDSVSVFLQDAQKTGIDFSKYEIIVNDRAYYTAASGISEIRTISLFVLVLTAAAGCIILYAIVAFYKRTRAKETMILYNLGMRVREIHLMYFIEYSFLILVSAVLAVSIGTVSANQVVRHLDETYIAELEEYANQKDTASDTALAFRSAALSYPVRMNFHKDSKTERLPFSVWISSEQQTEAAVRYEQFYDGSTLERIVVKGMDNPELYSGLGEEVLYHSNRMGGMEIPCYVPKDSGYSVGDSILLYRIPGEYYSTLYRYSDRPFRYGRPMMAYVSLRVKGVTEAENIEVNFDDLNMMCTYLGISSGVYRNIRYDSINVFDGNSEKE